MLRVDGVDAAYGPIQVLFDVSLQVEAGEVVALLGTNGAGKTTVLRAISGTVPVAAGTVTFEGTDLTTASPRERVEAGIIQLPGGRGVFPGMTVRENLEVGGYVFGRDTAARDEAIDAVVERFPVLQSRRGQQAGTMSGGEQQMLALAKAMVAQPRVLLVDELSLGLAPVIVEDLLGTLREYVDEGVAVVVVEQHVDLALEIAERAYFMERGQVRFDGPAEDLRGRDDLLRSVFLASA